MHNNAGVEARKMSVTPPQIANPVLRSRFSDQSIEEKPGYRPFVQRGFAPNSAGAGKPEEPGNSFFNYAQVGHRRSRSKSDSIVDGSVNLGADDVDITVRSREKASRVLGVRMDTIQQSRTSLVSTRSERVPRPDQPSSLPLASLYCVSGLPKSPNTWTLSDPDSVIGLHHSDGAVNRWWRPEVLGSTVSPGAGVKKRKAHLKGGDVLNKQEVARMLSKSLKLSFTREVEVIASTLQPVSTIHTFSFTLPAKSNALSPASATDLRASMLSDSRASATSFAYPYSDDPFVKPSSAYLGPPSLIGHGAPTRSNSLAVPGSGNSPVPGRENTNTYYGVCLTVWSHADAERSTAIRRTLEAGRMRKESAQSLVQARLKSIQSGSNGDADIAVQARRKTRKNARGPWGDGETDAETEAAMSDSDFEGGSTVGHGPGESTLFLPGDAVFWLPYALTLVSRHPVYDLMRDYLTLSWARFSKDVQSHTLQMAKILSHPTPKPGDVVRLDASPKSEGDSSLEVIARFPGGLDFGKGLVDHNYTMWPLFSCMSVDNILTICEIALAPTGRILFFSRHPALLGVAVNTIKYLLEYARKWDGISLPAVHSRDAKIYVEDPGPWIMGLATEARYSIRPPPEVCVCDLDINYINCASPPPGFISVKQQRDKNREKILASFPPTYHPDHSVPTEFKEAFPAGRFRPLCKVQAKRGAASTVGADPIVPPDWWHPTRIIQAFANVLQEKFKKPSLLRRLSSFGSVRPAPQLTPAEQHIQISIRKRASAFVDARDDLETKIGRLSRRLNFLMTESDLWRDKFVTFEQYAEKLSAEAAQLRTKIGKEQRETKRLSGIVTLTAAEKNKLQAQLKDTEVAHKDAQVELEKMKENMARMEAERAEMIAEVQAQLEQALDSMNAPLSVDTSEPEFDDLDIPSRPSSRMSSTSASKVANPRKPRSRRPSETDMDKPAAFVSSLDGDVKDSTGPLEIKARENGTIEEADEEEETKPTSSNKRFSTNEDLDLRAVDEGITQKSDKIAQKVMEIQQTLERALNDRKKPSTPAATVESDGSLPAKPKQKSSSRKTRGRSGTESSSAQTALNASADEGLARSRAFIKASTPEEGRTTPKAVAVNDGGSLSSEQEHSQSKNEPKATNGHLRRISSGASLSATPPTETPVTTPSLVGPAGTTDDSDTDFQSAYSNSPKQTSRVIRAVSDADDSTLSETDDTHPRKRGQRDVAGTKISNGKVKAKRNRKQEQRTSVSTVTAA